MRKLNEQSDEIGLQINTNKTKYLRNELRNDNPEHQTSRSLTKN